MRDRAALALAALIALAGAADAAQTAVSRSTLALSTVVPVTLAAGTQGTTALGANATRATTTVAQGGAPVAYTSLLQAASASASAQSTTLRFVSATNLNRLDAATISLAGTVQVVVLAGTVTQATGSAVALPAAGSLTLSGTFDKSNPGAKITLVLELVTSPATRPGVDLVERWTLRVD